MGGPVPKPLLRLGGLTIAERSLARIRDAVDLVLVSANDPGAFAFLGCPVVVDGRPDAGPLAGLHAAALYLQRHAASVGRVLVVPGDTPFLPADLASRLLSGPRDLVRVASIDGALQPTVAVWPMEALLGLDAILDEPGNRRSLRAALDRSGFDPVEFPRDLRAPGGQTFFNVNTPDDLAMAERYLGPCENGR